MCLFCIGILNNTFLDNSTARLIEGILCIGKLFLTIYKAEKQFHMIGRKKLYATRYPVSLIKISRNRKNMCRRVIYRITEPFCLEKTFTITESNHKPT